MKFTHKHFIVKTHKHVKRFLRKNIRKLICLLSFVFIISILYQQHDVTPAVILKEEPKDIIVESSNHKDGIDVDKIYTKGRYWKEFEPFTHSNDSEFDKFVIFDSEDYFGSLEFLDIRPKGWSVFVINAKDVAQMNTCPGCLAFSKSPEARDILERIRRKMIEEKILLHSYIIAKMAASIFAYKSKAPWIYVTDKQRPIPFGALSTIVMNHPEKGMVYKGPSSIFQPCGYFMDTFTWNGKGPLKGQYRYVLRPIPTSSLYQIVDNCYRDGSKPDWQSFMDYNAPLPFVMSGQWAALEFQNILIPRNFSWTLLASIKFKRTKFTTISNTSKVVLSLLVQRILWETNCSIGFVPEKMNFSQTSRLVECPSCDVEKSMFEAFGKWVNDKREEQLSELSWCNKNPTVLDCLEKAVLSEIVNGDTKRTPVENAIYLWVKLLEEFMDRIRDPLNNDKEKLEKDGNVIYFTTAKSLHKADKDGHTLPPNIFKYLCLDNGTEYSEKIPNKRPEIFNNVVLVISFNTAEYLTTIAHLEFTFGRYFKHIVYCADGVKWFKKLYLTKHPENPVTFTDVKINKGLQGHLCVVTAMEMNYYNVKGF